MLNIYSIALLSVIFVLFLSFSSSSDETIVIPETVCDTNGQCVAQAQAKVPKFANEEGKPPEIDTSICEDRHPNCQLYASQGECEFMFHI